MEHIKRVEYIHAESEKVMSTRDKIVGVVLVVAFVLLFLLLLVSFSAAANNYRVTEGASNHKSAACVLASTYTGDSNLFRLYNGPCKFVIGGGVTIAVYGLVAAILVFLRLMFCKKMCQV